MFRNPRRTRAGVGRPGVAGRSQGRRRSAASVRARLELGVDSDDQSGPPVRGVRVADRRGGPAPDLLEQADRSQGASPDCIHMRIELGESSVIGIDGLLAVAAVVRRLREGQAGRPREVSGVWGCCRVP
jgi:hypothetical protein